MDRKKSNITKIVAMIGGLLILIGIVLIGIAALSLSGYLNVSILLEERYFWTFALAMVVIGLLDTSAAIIIARW